MEEEKEIWKDISGCPGYQVSNIGRVKSIERKVKLKNGSIRTIRERILKPEKNSGGYFRVKLCKNGKEKSVLVHRLVADAFLTNHLNLPQINHRNEIKEDNRVDNLEYCDAKYNSNYGTRNERMAKTLTNHPKKSKQVKCLETGIVYLSLGDIQRKFGFSQSNICKCCNGKRNTCGGYHWRYVD